MVALDSEANNEECDGLTRSTCHLVVDGGEGAAAVIMWLEMTSGDAVAVAYFEDECHVYSSGWYSDSLSIGCWTLATVDVHADCEPGIGRAKTMLVYDPNDPVTG